jgi:hypothetical protein
LLKLDDTAAIFASGATAFLLWVYAPAQIAIETSRYIITGYFLFRIGLEVDAWIYSLRKPTPTAPTCATCRIQ